MHIVDEKNIRQNYFCQEAVNMFLNYAVEGLGLLERQFFAPGFKAIISSVTK